MGALRPKVPSQSSTWLTQATEARSWSGHHGGLGYRGDPPWASAMTAPGDVLVASNPPPLGRPWSRASTQRRKPRGVAKLRLSKVVRRLGWCLCWNLVPLAWGPRRGRRTRMQKRGRAGWTGQAWSEVTDPGVRAPGRGSMLGTVWGSLWGCPSGLWLFS